MKQIFRAINTFLNNEDAQAMVEYALLALVFALASYGAVKLFIEAWKSKYNKVTATRSGVPGIYP